MNNQLVRGIAGVLGGVVVAVVVVGLLEGLGHMIYPPPPGLDLTTAEGQARLMDVMPVGAKVAVVTAWFLGALAGGIVAARIGQRALYAWVIGAIMVALSVTTTMMFPHPLWMVLAGIALPIVAAVIAIRIDAPRVIP